MKTEDLKLVSNLGQALWTQPEQSSSIMKETVSAVSFLDANPKRAAEKTIQALLDRANLKGMYARVPTGFSSMFPEERFILLALHQGRWPYERVARVVGESVEMVQQLAWNARVYMALSHYPVAPTQTSPDCPEYNPQRPWTQKFLDGEHSGQERHFLQIHLTGCTACREALVRTKDVYYRVQDQLQKLAKKSAESGLTAQLQSVIQRGHKLKYPSTATQFENFLKFLGRPEIQFVLIAWFAFLLWSRL